MTFTIKPSRWTSLFLETLGALAIVLTLTIAGVSWAETETEDTASELAVPPHDSEPGGTGSSLAVVPVAEAVADAVAEPLAEELVAPALHATFLGDEYVEATEPASDLFMFGRTAISRANIEDNALVFAQFAEVRDGRIDGDLLVGGERMVIDAPVGGDVYAFGGELHILEGGMVGGDILSATGKIIVEGKVGGRITGGSGAVVIDGVVGEVCDLEVGQMKIGENAVIAGDLCYSAPEPATIADGAQVMGDTQYTVATHDDWDSAHEDDDEGGILGWFVWHLWLLLAALVTGSVLIRISGPAARRTSDALLTQPGRSLGLGFVAMILIPAASAMAMVLIVPLPLGMIGMALYGIALYVTGLIASHALGRALLRRFTGLDEVSPYGSLALGLVIVHLFLAIPFFGFLARLVIVSAGLGALWVASRNGADPEPDAA